MADKLDETTSMTVTRESVFGNKEEILILAYKVAKKYVLQLNSLEFTDQQIQTEFLDAKDKIAKMVDDWQVTVVEETLKIAVDEDLLEDYQKTEVQQKRMRSEPFYHYLDYKTYAWMLAINGDTFLWEERIQDFDDWSVKGEIVEEKNEEKTDL